MATYAVSVVMATYNRKSMLIDLLRDFAAQEGIEQTAFEIIVVDDGSREPVRRDVEALHPPYRVRVLEQTNSGQAVARHRGILAAEGDLVVIVDDDMRVPPEFLAAHREAHAAGIDVVLGLIEPSWMPTALFERWHACQLERFAQAVIAGRRRVQGEDLATGNVSFPRQLYLEVGGFDTSLTRSEDRELGLRLAQAGARLGLSARARSVNYTDHANLEIWLKHNFDYGVNDVRICRKHPQAENSDPWKFIFHMQPIARPWLCLAVLWPSMAGALVRALIGASMIADRAGLERLAFAGTALTWGMTYFRGVRAESGSALAAAHGLLAYLRKRQRAERGRSKADYPTAGFAGARAGRPQASASLTPAASGPNRESAA
jgi:glycosyltransferase involved in cell wall biosynthesis